jgi:hypothetical protein
VSDYDRQAAIACSIIVLILLVGAVALLLWGGQ